MYCKNCGRAVDDNSLYCYNCGVRLDNTSSENISEDNSSFGFAVLGFFIPIAGFILFLIYEDYINHFYHTSTILLGYVRK